MAGTNSGVETFGRLSYFDPNVSVFLNAQGNLSDSIRFPYEDYNMAIELLIREYNRYSCGFSNVSGEFLDYVYSTDKGTLSFFGGTKLGPGDSNGYLTTKYTDVSMTNPSDNTHECLGIESINITYQSWFHPQVTIKFVDVRGATVMQQAENAYYNPNDLGSNSQIYKAFFSFPYPLFVLKVKGFYGRGVTYKLAISKTTIEFDANSGNFIITAEFIGHMYGIFADLPMTYVAIAPYMNVGKEYWDKRVEDGTFCFRGPSGEIECPMIKFPKLKKVIAEAIASSVVIEAEKKVEEKSDNIQSQIDSITNIMNQYVSIFGTYGIESNNRDHKKYLYVTQQGITSDFYEKVSGFYNSLKEQDITYKTSFYNRFGGHKKNDGDYVFSMEKNAKQPKETALFFEAVTTNEGIGTSYKIRKKYEKDKRAEYLYLSGDTALMRSIDEKRGALLDFYVAVLDKGTEENFSDLIFKVLSDYKEELVSKLSKHQSTMTSVKNQALVTALGFTPSIRNIFELAFAHMDTFLEVFYTYMKEIKSQLDNKLPYREKNHYPEVKDELTDTEKRMYNVSPDLVRANYLPPFVAYYKPNTDPSITDNNGSMMKSVLRWPGNMKYGGDLIEVGYIQNMIDAAKMYYTENERYQKEIDSIISGQTINANAPSSDIYNFIPLTTYDYATNGNVENPYKKILPDLMGNKKESIGEIFLTLAMRAFYYNAVNHDSNDDYSFGKAEALNFYKAIGEIKSPVFYEFLKKYADDKDEGSEENKFIEYITTKNKISGITDVWVEENAVNCNGSLFRKSGDYLLYNYYKPTSATNFSYFPLDLNVNLKSDFVKGDNLRYNSKYISSRNPKGYSGSTSSLNFEIGKPLACGTFMVIEDRDFLKNIFQKMKNAIESTEDILEAKGKSYGIQTDALAGLRDKDLNRISDNVRTDNGDHFYASEAFWSPTGNDGRKDLYNIMLSGTPEDIETIFIKWPTEINDCTGTSLFHQYYYALQGETRIVAKACMFLQAIPLLGPRCSIDTESFNGITAKSVLLREGALYWLKNNMDDESKILFDGKVRKPNGEVEWVHIKKPVKHTEEDRYPSLIHNDSGLDSMTFDTLYPITATTSGQVGSYFSFTVPKGSSQSRRAYLEQYFVNWATTEYAEMEPLLMDHSVYVDKNYTKGLNCQDAFENRSIDDDKLKGVRLQEMLRKLFFTMCTTLDYYHGADFGDNKYEARCGIGRMKDSYRGFVDGLEDIYGDFSDALNGNGELGNMLLAGEVDDPFQSEELKLSTYMTMKNLYDKWLSGSYHGEDTYRFRRKQGDSYELDNFIYCDNFFHDIGWNLIVNITKVGEWLNQLMPSSELAGEDGKLTFKSKSIYEFLTDIAELCGGYILAIPQRMMYTDANSIADAFRPIPSCQQWDDDTSTYMFLYTYRPSEHLGGTESSNIDMNGWSREGDGFDLTNMDIVGTLFGDYGSTVPAFGVTFGKQNQSYFKNIKLSSASPAVTEVGISNTMDIASKAGEESRQTTLFGQDIYKVYSNYAYECTVEMLGCMQIFPPMYFQLNNIPMWKGAYMIQKVSHNIAPGDITTTFTGVRQNKYTIPMANPDMVGFVGCFGGSVEATNITETVIDESFINEPVAETNVAGNRNMILPKVDESDFTAFNITPTKPLICLTPAHGPNTEKNLEWAWSTKLIDNYIIPKLKKQTFKDGTSYANNIHRCNVGGKNTGSGYNCREASSLVNKYGSKCVISVVPHWNGGGAKYHATYDGKQIGTRTYKDGKPYWWENPRNPRMRKDSAIFAEYMRAEVKKVVDKEDTYRYLPSGMMNQGVNKTHLLYTASYNDDKTDPALNLNCPCILTENFFADYKISEDAVSCFSDNFQELGDDGRYQNGRAWLESNEGLNVIADMHVAAIVNFINSLKDE